MASVAVAHGVRIRGGTTCGDAALDIGPEEWPELVRTRREFCEKVVPADCRLLLFFVQDAENAGWLGFEDRNQYLRDGLNLDPQLVDWALEGLKSTRPDLAIGFEDAIGLGKKGAPLGNKNAAKDRDKNKRYNITFVSRGTSSAYILARLRRDRPDLAALVDAKELSPNAAAIEAGFRRKTFSVPDDVDAAVNVFIRRFGADELQKALSRSKARDAH